MGLSFAPKAPRPLSVTYSAPSGTERKATRAVQPAHDHGDGGLSDREDGTSTIARTSPVADAQRVNRNEGFLEILWQSDVAYSLSK
jgi:hypothetical protein